MLAAIEDRSEVSNSDPVLARLPPWLENPYRPVSLLDIVMVVCSGENLFWAGAAIEILKSDCFMKSGIGKYPLPPIYFKGPIDKDTNEKAIDWLTHIERECELLGMPVSAETTAELRTDLESGKTIGYEFLQSGLDHLKDLIRKEMKTKTFLHVTPDKMRTWPRKEKPHIFGEHVAKSFPSASVDISEAGVSLALGRATASVFHLMRVLEIGLTVLGAVFGISLAHTNWAPAIEQIESKIRDMHKDPVWKALPDCKEQQEFYAQTASHFGILKDAWRNYTAHARGVYTEEKAALIFDNVREFMQTLAPRLHE